MELRRHNADLAAEVRRHAERDRRHREEHGRKTGRIEWVLHGDGPAMVFQAIAELRRKNRRTEMENEILQAGGGLLGPGERPK